MTAQIKKFVAILSAIVVMSLFVAACSTPSVDQPASLVVTRQIMQMEVAKPEPVDDQGGPTNNRSARRRARLLSGYPRPPLRHAVRDPNAGAHL